MSEKEIEEYNEKLLKGLRIAEIEMLEEKALRGECVVVSDSDGKIIHIPAAQVLKASKSWSNV